MGGRENLCVIIGCVIIIIGCECCRSPLEFVIIIIGCVIRRVLAKRSPLHPK